MSEDDLRKLVNRYLEKKSTDEELEVFVHLMKEGKLDQYIEESMIKATANSDLAELPTAAPKSLFMRFRWPVAAAIGLIIATSVYYSTNKGTSISKIVQADTVKINNSSWVNLKQSLPDGSIVWMSPNTRLSYPVRFSQSRSINMEGEAYFEVAKDHAHPFMVTSGGILTKVLGTSFRIRSFPGTKDTRVSVLSGKVAVSIPVEKGTVPSAKDQTAKEMVLLPKEEATYQSAVHHLQKAAILPGSDVYLWRKSSLSFDNTKLSDIVAVLSSSYHIDIVIMGDKLQQIKLTADFTGKHLADILELICKSMPVTYSQENNKIILEPKIIRQPISTN